jgi:hypothetical protein
LYAILPGESLHAAPVALRVPLLADHTDLAL